MPILFSMPSFLVSITKGITTAKRSGPEITGIMETGMAGKKEKFGMDSCWSVAIVQHSESCAAQFLKPV